MNDNEKFAFKHVLMSEDVEVLFIKLLTSLETKPNDFILEAFKDLTDSQIEGHAEMLVRTQNKIIFQTSEFNRTTSTYRNWELWVFTKDSGSWNLNRFSI